MNKCMMAMTCLLAALPMQAALARGTSATWTVTGLTDVPTGSCSGLAPNYSCTTLRDAFNLAGSGDTITFANAINGGTILLTQSSNDTSAGSTEFGASAFFLNSRPSVIIDGRGHGITIARDPAQPAFRLFDVDTASTLTLMGLTLRNGLAQGGSSFAGGGALGAGGAIFNQGSLVMDHCTLAQNAAQGGSGGVGSPASGGAGVGGDVVGANGSGPNGARAGAPPGNAGFGGGGGTAQGTNEIGGSGGFGGGGGAGSGNSAGLGGGGSGGFGGGGGSNTYTKGNGGFGGGQSGGAIDHPPTGGGGAGMGGAIFNDAGSVTLTNVTFYKNAASGGNATYAGITNVAGGNGSGYGGAIFNYAGSLSLSFVTLSANATATGNGGTGGAADGGAIFSYGDTNCGNGDGNTCNTSGTATLALLNSIAARSTGAANDIVVNSANGTSTVDTNASAGNLVMTSTGVPGTAILTNANPQLGSLSPYASTLAPATLPIPQTSPAYNAAASCVDLKGATIANDERGVSRPQPLSTSACDIGAYEYDGDYIFANGFDF